MIHEPKLSQRSIRIILLSLLCTSSFLTIEPCFCQDTFHIEASYWVPAPHNIPGYNVRTGYIDDLNRNGIFDITYMLERGSRPNRQHRIQVIEDSRSITLTDPRDGSALGPLFIADMTGDGILDIVHEIMWDQVTEVYAGPGYNCIYSEESLYPDYFTGAAAGYTEAGEPTVYYIPKHIYFDEVYIDTVDINAIRCTKRGLLYTGSFVDSLQEYLAPVGYYPKMILRPTENRPTDYFIVGQVDSAIHNVIAFDSTFIRLWTSYNHELNAPDSLDFRELDVIWNDYYLYDPHVDYKKELTSPVLDRFTSNGELRWIIPYYVDFSPDSNIAAFVVVDPSDLSFVYEYSEALPGLGYNNPCASGFCRGVWAVDIDDDERMEILLHIKGYPYRVIDPETFEVIAVSDSSSPNALGYDCYLGKFSADAENLQMGLCGLDGGILIYNLPANWRVYDSVETDARHQRPTGFCLNPAYPNPFNSTTTISYSLPCASLVSIGVFNLNGRMCASIMEGESNAGYHRITWDAGDLPSGTYLLKVIGEDFEETARLMLVK